MNNFLVFNRFRNRSMKVLQPACSLVNDKVASDSKQVRQIYTVSPAARHRCDDPSELCSPGAKTQRRAPQLLTRFGIIPRVGLYSIMKI